MTHAGKQTVLITGAASGIGQQAALALAARGHRVIATARSLERLAGLRQEAEARGLTLIYDVLDIANEQQARQLAAKHTVNTLLCNAAIGDTGPIVEVPLPRVRANFEINVTGTLAVIQAFVPQMMQRRGGRVVVMSSMAALAAPPFFNPYASTKAALESLCASLRMELRRFDVQVAVINPGRINGGHNAEIVAAKYDWLAPNSPYRPFLADMKRHDAAILRGGYPIRSIMPSIIATVESPRPRLRYAAPFKYRLGLGLMRLLPTRLIEWIMRQPGRLAFLK